MVVALNLQNGTSPLVLRNAVIFATKYYFPIYMIQWIIVAIFNFYWVPGNIDIIINLFYC